MSGSVCICPHFPVELPISEFIYIFGFGALTLVL